MFNNYLQCLDKELIRRRPQLHSSVLGLLQHSASVPLIKESSILQYNKHFIVMHYQISTDISMIQCSHYKDQNSIIQILIHFRI